MINTESFIKKFEGKVKNTIKKYDLTDKKDKIIVACSGGKDSTTALYLLKKFGYNVEALTIDLLIGPWSEKNLSNIKKFCRNNKIELHIVNIRKEFGSSICYIRSGIQTKIKLNNCMICGVIKRWLLNKKARELGAAKLATGHNLDDESETVMMNLLKGNIKLGLGLGPKTGIISDKKFVQRIKPLYFCSNKEVKTYSKIMDFPVLYEPCPCAVGNLRRKVREELIKLETINSDIKINIVNNFLNLIPTLIKSCKSTGKLRYCSNCGEPCRGSICKTCELIILLKGKSTNLAIAQKSQKSK